MPGVETPVENLSYFRSGIILRMASQKKIIAVLILIVMFLAACSQTLPSPTSIVSPLPTQFQPSASPVQPTTTFTPLSPTPTLEPMAVLVNGEGITLANYTAEFRRFQAALKELGQEMAPEDIQKTVLDEMIDQVLLVQSAVQSGYSLSDADFQKRLDDVIAKNGGAQSFAGWLEQNYYTEDSFRSALQSSLAAAWQRDQILSTAPTTAEQVHARQILVLNQDLADRLYAQLQAGADFATLALQVDPDTGGELGWFPRGYLFLPEIETAAFDLQPGNYSPIIKTDYGYHIVYLIERDANHPLSPDAQIKANRAFLETWLKTKRSQSQIQMIVN